MTDFFFQMGLSNACFSLALGIVAMVVGAKARRPHLAYMLWLLVFVKLVTPPIVTIPLVTIPAHLAACFRQVSDAANRNDSPCHDSGTGRNCCCDQRAFTTGAAAF